MARPVCPDPQGLARGATPPLCWAPAGLGASGSSSLGGSGRGRRGSCRGGLSGAGWAEEVHCQATWHLRRFFLGIHSLIQAADHRVWLPEGWGGLQQAWTKGPLSPGRGKTRWGLVGKGAGGRCCHKRTDRQTEPLERSHRFNFSRLNPRQPMSNSGPGSDSHTLPPPSGGPPDSSTRPPLPPGVYGWLPTSP